MGAGRQQGVLAWVGKKWALPPALPVWCLRSWHPSEVGSPPQSLGCTCALLVRVSYTAVMVLSILSLGKNVQHSSYSKQHPWCLISWVHFTPQWLLAVNFHTSAVCLGSSPYFLNWAGSGTGSLPCMCEKGCHLSSLSQRDAWLRLLGRTGGQVSSISLSLPELRGKCLGKDLTHNILDKIWSKIYEESW